MSAVISTSSPAVDLAAVKTRQQAAWSTGNYAEGGHHHVERSVGKGQVLGVGFLEQDRVAFGLRAHPPGFEQR